MSNSITPEPRRLLFSCSPTPSLLGGAIFLISIAFSQATATLPNTNLGPTPALRIMTNRPYVHLKNYDNLEDRTTGGLFSYPAPAGAPVAESVTANAHYLGKRHPISLYQTPVYGGMALHGSFDCNEPTEIEIHFEKNPPRAVVVRPLQKRITAVMTGNTARFKVPGPGKYTVETDGHLEDAIHLFVNCLEKDPPHQGGPNTIYFAPGYYEDVGTFVLSNDQTLYLAGGAYLHRANIQVKNARGVTIRGRGIIDTGARLNGYAKKDPRTTHCLSAFNTQNLTVEGLTFLDPEVFCTVYRRSQDLRIRNVKIIAKDGNTDQNDIVGCQRVHISEVFYRGYDDGIVIKVAIETRDFHSTDILAENSVIWTDKAHALTVGTEVLNNVYHVTFSNIDVLHVREPGDNSRALAIHVGDNGTVHDILFTDIRIENLSPPFANGGIDLIQLQVKPNVYSKSGLPGHIRNITFRNIELVNAPFFPPIEISGFGPSNTIENIHFENLRLFGTNMTEAHQLRWQTNQWVRDIFVQ